MRDWKLSSKDNEKQPYNQGKKGYLDYIGMVKKGVILRVLGQGAAKCFRFTVISLSDATNHSAKGS